MKKVEPLQNVTTKDLEAINALQKQLSRSSWEPLTYAQLLDVVKDNNVTPLVARDGGKIVGLGVINIFHTILGKHATLEDMVVDETYRGQGLGVKIGQALLDFAKKEHVVSVELTVRPSREAANKLYQKLGFEQRETNVYRLKL